MGKTGHFDNAIELQKQYLEICRMHDDRVGESAARAALASAYEAIGNTAEAIKQLENLLNVASEAGELKAQASACLNLGILYNGRGDHEKSVELLEQHFDLARQIGAWQRETEVIYRLGQQRFGQIAEMEEQTCHVGLLRSIST